MQRALVIQTAFFGDVILATALIEQWRKQYPTCEIDMVVDQGKEVLLHNHPHIRRVWPFDKSKKYSALYRLIGEIRRMKYEVVINIHRHGSSGLIAGLSGSPQRIGFDVHPLSWLFTHKVKHQKEGRHEVDRNFDLIAHLVEDAGDRRPRVYPSEADFEKVARARSYVTISPASVWFTKQWPQERWAGLADRVPAHMDVLLLGGPGDKPVAEKVANAARRPIEIMCGKYSFLESAALMAGATMNFANDSAPIHLASAVNAPMRAIFCSTVPRFGYGPLSDDSRIVETDMDLDCRPCGIHGHRQCPLGHFKCSHIALDKVMESIVWPIA